MSNLYDPVAVEEAAQDYWDEEQSFEVKEDISKEKFFCISMLPYPSGELHVGHIRNYTLGDLISRYQRLKGKNVLQPMGWDAFGLPAENASIQRDTSPAEWTEKNIKKMRKVFKQMGYAYDWSRELATCDPNYYRWEQWLFLKMYEKGLVYQKEATVNWDPVDQTVLANEQVIDGKGWRSGAPVEQRAIKQWFFKITAYADELLEKLDTLKGWPEQVVTMQRNWIGRSQGTVVFFSLQEQKEKLTVFTTRPDTLMGVTYISVAANHPLAKEAAKKDKTIALILKKFQAVKMAEADLATREKEGIFSGFYAIHPLSKKELPIWISNFVLMEYGTGAVMGVPAHDSRDHEFAVKYDLPIQAVIKPTEALIWDYKKEAFIQKGILINSDPFNHLSSEQAGRVITDYLKKNNQGDYQIHYRLRDWGVSRQRYWGTPIPIIYCKDCGMVPVPEKSLPVILPLDIKPTGHGSPLAESSEFYKTKCPTCGKAAKRETDTLDTFVESSWYYARYCCANQDRAILDNRAKYWTPVDQYIGGIEHAVMHLLYARFIHKVLRDLGLLNSDEPFTNLLTQGMVLKDSVKMSKSKGNVVQPAPLIKKYGADTVRLFSIFSSPPEQSLEWSDSGVEGCFRFLKKLWRFCIDHQSLLETCHHQYRENFLTPEDSQHQMLRKQLHEIVKQANDDIQRLQFNTVASACMKLFNLIAKLDPRDLEQQALIYEGIHILLRLISPITPHIAHTLWRTLHFGEDILYSKWPLASHKALESQEVALVIQINGKLRAHIQVPVACPQKEIETRVLKEDSIQRHLENKKIKKIIVVPNKLVNIVV